MSTNQSPSAMRRKAGAGRPPPEIGQLTPGRALRQAIAQAAQDVAGLAAVAGAPEEVRTTLTPVVEGLPEHPLLGLVEGPDSRFGLFVLDGQAVAALIEMQTTGRVVPRPAAARAPTRTDAIMCADFIDRALELIEAQLGEADLPVAPAFSGFRYAMALAESRAIAMTLDDIPYRRLSLTVDFGHGAKSGEVALILPFDPPGQGAGSGKDGAAFTAALETQVLGAEACLAATLARRRMTLAEVTRLKVGSVIALPREVLGAVEIEDIDGRVVARGRLGQGNGHRAVRVTANAQAAGGQGGVDFAGTASPPPLIEKPGEPAGDGIDPLAALSEPDRPPAGFDLPGAGLADLEALGDLGALGDAAAEISG